jgi:4-amino-4-deoxy-L-arabinose transferase-like glycosyltransferase
MGGAWLALVLGLLLAARLVAAGLAGLSHDEAYYWDWSRAPAWGYYDHPPLVAWLVWLGRQALGETELAVRVACVALSVAATGLLFAIARSLSGARAAWVAAACAAAAPLLSVAGILATPDVPLVCAWTAALWLALRALASGRTRAWLACGLALGLGALAKQTMALAPAALAAGMLATPRGRAALRTRGPWLAALVAALVCAPYLRWLAALGGAPLANQLAHGLGAAAGGESGPNPLLSLGAFVGAQALLVTPILFALGLWALWRAGRELAADPDAPDATALAVLFFAAALPLGVFGTASLLAYSHPNWPAVAWPALFVLLGRELARSGRRAWRWGVAGLALAALASLHLVVEAVHPLVPYPRGAMTMVRDHSDWTDWAQRLREARGEAGLQAMVTASDYKLAALLAFHLPDHPRTDAPFERRSGAQYALWRAQRPPAPSDHAWYFSSESEAGAAARAAEILVEPELVDSYTPTRLGRELRTLRAYYGRRRAADRHERG